MSVTLQEPVRQKVPVPFCHASSSDASVDEPEVPVPFVTAPPDEPEVPEGSVVQEVHVERVVRVRRRRAVGTAVARFDPDAPLFLISTAANLANMHPQTLRTYDRLGLVTPKRTSGKGRRYTLRDVEKLRLVQYLSQDEGINLAGVRHILELQSEVERLQSRVSDLLDEIATLHRSTTSGRVFTASQAQGVWLRRTR